VVPDYENLEDFETLWSISQRARFLSGILTAISRKIIRIKGGLEDIQECFPSYCIYA
jgi:hypothetical protein